MGVSLPQVLMLVNCLYLAAYVSTYVNECLSLLGPVAGPVVLVLTPLPSLVSSRGQRLEVVGSVADVWHNY
jgi:hypothetical protein